MPTSINNIRYLCAAAAFVATATTAQTASSQTTSAPIRDSVHQSSIGGTNSGAQGSDRILRRRVSENRGLVRLVLAERGDAPCELTTGYRRLTNNSYFAGTGAFQNCNNNNGGTNQSRRTITLPRGYYATGVRVCLNNAGNKVKGVQLIGKRRDCLTMNVPQLQANPGCLAFQHFERTNCVGTDRGIPDADWVPAASCPLTHVAIGVQISSRPTGGGRRSIDGIGLKCARVTQ